MREWFRLLLTGAMLLASSAGFAEVIQPTSIDVVVRKAAAPEMRASPGAQAWASVAGAGSGWYVCESCENQAEWPLRVSAEEFASRDGYRLLTGEEQSGPVQLTLLPVEADDVALATPPPPGPSGPVIFGAGMIMLSGLGRLVGGKRPRSTLPEQF